MANRHHGPTTHARRWGRRTPTDDPREDVEDKPASEPLHVVWGRFHADADAGIALTRSGTPYKPRALADYDSAMRTHVLPRLGSKPFREITSPAVQLFVDDLARAKVSPSRQAAAVTALRALTRWASRRGIGERVSDIQLPRVQSRTLKVRMPADVDRLLRLVDSPKAAMFAAIAAYTGARAYEIVALEPGDIDLDARTIRLAGREDARKSPAARRTVPIVDALVPWLGMWDGKSVPFGERPRLRQRYDRVYLDTRRAWEQEEPRPTPHTLRHNWISWMFAAGVPLPSLQALSGHETPPMPGVTLAVYGHAMPRHVETARATMNRWIAEQA